MILGLLLLSCLQILALTYDFNLSTDGSKLMTWINADGIESSLLLFSLQTTPQTVLKEKMELPYSFIVDQNCSVTQSITQANIFSLNTVIQIQLQYIYMKGQTIISNNSVKFTTNTTLNLDNDTLLIISSNDLFLSMPQSSISTEQNLYMYSNQTLIQFDSKLFSSEPSCYLLSEMTTDLCLSKHCSALSSQQVYDMGIGTVIKNYSFIDGRITLPVSGSSNKAQFVYLKLQQSSHPTSSQLQHITQEQVTISGSTIINVSFQISQITIASNISTQSISSSLRVNSPPQNITTYNINIKFTNSQPVYSIKTIKLYIGEQLIESYKVMFKPLQQVNYSLVWKSDQSQIIYAEIYSENLTLQNRYSMNNFVDFLFNQQKQLLKNSPNGVIQNSSVNEISTVQMHDQKLTLMIVLIAVGGSLFLSVLGVWFFRKRIFKRCCYQQENQEQKQDKKKDVKNDQICEVPQTAKEIKDCDQLTFNKREILFKQTPFVESKEKKQNKISHINPQEVESKDYLSTDGQNPSNQTSQKAQVKGLPTYDSITDVKIKTLPSENRSLSITQNYSKGFTKRPLTKNMTSAITDSNI